MFTMPSDCGSSSVTSENIDRGKDAGRRRVSDADLLRWLALAAIRRSENFQCQFVADALQAAPEVSRDAAIIGVLDHGRELAAFDQLAPFAAELEFVARIVDRPRAVGPHEHAMLDAGDHLIERCVT